MRAVPRWGGRDSPVGRRPRLLPCGWGGPASGHSPASAAYWQHPAWGVAMSTVLIVGGGQAGLHLGNALLVTGHEVTLLTDRDAEQLRTGAIRSTHFTAPLALERQRAD